MAIELPISSLEAHPLNSNVMSVDQLKKLQRHLERSGRYEPLVVRPVKSNDPAAAIAPPAGGRYQVLNGHHRLEALRQLGHQAVRCEVWEVDDQEALLLLATLNRLEGRDDPMRRALLLAKLSDAAAGRQPGDLLKLLPEDIAALDRALALARQPLPRPRAPESLPAPFKPLTFFLTAAQLATVEDALRQAQAELGSASPSSPASPVSPVSQTLRVSPPPPLHGQARAAALVHLAERFSAATAEKPTVANAVS